MKTTEFSEMVAFDCSSLKLQQGGNLDLQQEGNDNCYGSSCDRVKCDN